MCRAIFSSLAATAEKYNDPLLGYDVALNDAIEVFLKSRDSSRLMRHYVAILNRIPVPILGDAAMKDLEGLLRDIESVNTLKAPHDQEDVEELYTGNPGASGAWNLGNMLGTSFEIQVGDAAPDAAEMMDDEYDEKVVIAIAAYLEFGIHIAEAVLNEEEPYEMVDRPSRDEVEEFLSYLEEIGEQRELTESAPMDEAGLPQR